MWRRGGPLPLAKGWQLWHDLTRTPAINWRRVWGHFNLVDCLSRVHRSHSLGESCGNNMVTVQMVIISRGTMHKPTSLWGWCAWDMPKDSLSRTACGNSLAEATLPRGALVVIQSWTITIHRCQPLTPALIDHHSSIRQLSSTNINHHYMNAPTSSLCSTAFEIHCRAALWCLPQKLRCSGAVLLVPGGTQSHQFPERSVLFYHGYGLFLVVDPNNHHQSINPWWFAIKYRGFVWVYMGLWNFMNMELDLPWLYS